MSPKPSSQSQSSHLLTQSLLNDKNYDIEFFGYLSNHVKHAIIALSKLNAPDQRIQEYWDNYTTLTPYSIPLHKVPEPNWDLVKPCSIEEFGAWRGSKTHWQEMVKHISTAHQQEMPSLSSTDELVRRYFPQLLSGLAGSLLHGIIHLGWAIDAGNTWMIYEGLAYLNYCHVGVDQDKLTFDTSYNEESSPLESLLRIAEEWHAQDLGETWIIPTKAKYDKTFHPELDGSGFQWELAKALKDAHPISTTMPSWLYQTPIKPTLWEALYRSVVTLYLATRNERNEGDFLVLHFLTALWALEHVCCSVNDDSTTHAALQQFWAVAIVALSVRSKQFPSKEALRRAVEEAPYAATDADDYDWSGIVARGIAEQEEHNIKLVRVTKALWHRYGHWSGFSMAAISFTTTPNINPNKSDFKA